MKFNLNIRCVVKLVFYLLAVCSVGCVGHSVSLNSVPQKDRRIWNLEDLVGESDIIGVMSVAKVDMQITDDVEVRVVTCALEPSGFIKGHAERPIKVVWLNFWKAIMNGPHEFIPIKDSWYLCFLEEDKESGAIYPTTGAVHSERSFYFLSTNSPPLINRTLETVDRIEELLKNRRNDPYEVPNPVRSQSHP